MRQMTTGRWERHGNTITLFGAGTILGATMPLGRSTALEAEFEFETQPVLRRGAKGAAVSDLQRRLASAKFSPGTIDGDFGARTESAVRAFQASRGLIVDGIVGPATWGALGSPAPTPTPAPSTGDEIPLSKLLAAMRSKRYVVYEKPFQLNIVGVRSLARPNAFDDTMNVFYRNDSGSWELQQSACTTDPGKYYLQQPMNVKGTAIVVPGQYIGSHQIGLHRGKYTALVQRGPITVVRDADRDDRINLDTGTRESGLFGINIHRSKASGTGTVVDQFSAGCQVFASSTDFARFIELCQRHRERHGNVFTYTLLNIADVV